MVKIVDNYLDEYKFDKLRKMIVNQQFHWTWTDYVAREDEEKSLFYLTHVLCANQTLTRQKSWPHIHVSQFYNSFLDIFTNMVFDKVINMAKPSYGNYNTPTTLGVQPLVHKPYFGGAHAYIVSPDGAKLLIEKAKTDAGPTDVFLNVHNFPWLQEYYPWIAEAKDSFTTIQKEKGCLAKHNYNENYEIL